MSVEPGSVMPCGAAVDDLLDQIQAGRGRVLTAHQQGCASCRAALAEYGRLFAPLRELARERVTVPRTTVDEALVRLRARGEHPVPPWAVDTAGTGPGRTRVGERVVVACARRAAERVPGVRAALVHAAARGDGDATLEVVLAAAYGVDLVALGEAVRRAVSEEVTARTGVVARSVSALVDTVIA